MAVLQNFSLDIDLIVVTTGARQVKFSTEATHNHTCVILQILFVLQK
jgi:hypothetical protein